MMTDMQPILRKTLDSLEAHRIAPGQYRRWTRRPSWCEDSLGINAYGCADAANILYTIGEFPRCRAEREAFIHTLQSMQDPATGLFHEGTHHVYHTTAHCIAALELFDTRPLHPLKAFAFTNEEGALENFLDNIGWMDEPSSPAGHLGAGIYAAMVNAGEASPDWCARWYNWFWEHTDPDDGFWRKGDRAQGSRLAPHMRMGGGFHFIFCLEHGRQPLRYPEKIIDTCLAMYDSMPPHFFGSAHFLQIDWIYCLSRASRQTPHRRDEIREAIRRFAHIYIGYLLEADFRNDPSLDDLHLLFGSLCAAAEIQDFLRGEWHSDKPLKLVLDRRPFI